MAELVVGLVDVFAHRPYEGNPLAVVEGGESLSDEQMRRIAGELNQAETTYLLHSDRADWKLRSFTAAGAEVFGAGHNALGAWLWLGELGRLGHLNSPATFLQELGDDVLPIVVARLEGRVHGRMRQAPLQLLASLQTFAPLAASLGLGTGDLLTTPAPRVASTGAPHLLVRAIDRHAVDRAEPDHRTLLAVLQGVGAEGCYLYAHDAEAPSAAYARFFNPTVGLWEDAATGTAAGPLAGYLRHAGVLDGTRLTVEQGVRLGRRSLLELELTPDSELSGTGIVVLQGHLASP